MAGVSDYIVGLRHVGIVTEDMDVLVARLQSLFGIADDGVHYVDAPETRFAFLTIGGTPYEVIEPVSESYRDILLNSNQGTNHVCYTVSDIEAATAAMAQQGVRPGHVTPDGILDLPASRMVYFNPEDTAGILIEFIESAH